MTPDKQTKQQLDRSAIMFGFILAVVAMGCFLIALVVMAIKAHGL